MDSAKVPLLSEHLDDDLTAPLSTRNFSKPFGFPSAPSSPQLTLHEYRKRQQLPFLAPASPGPGTPRLRRKASRSNLSASASASGSVSLSPSLGRNDRDSEDSPPREVPLLPSSSSRDLVPPLPSPLAFPHHQHPTAASPSLSSTIDTLQSTPTRTPLSPFEARLREQSGPESDARFVNPIRTKRKFPQLKEIKRLPRRVEDHEWLVYAGIRCDLDDDDVTEFVTDAPRDARVTKKLRGGLVGGVGLRADVSTPVRRDRSVRFAGIWSESEGGSERIVQEGEKEGPGDSSYTLSKFKFPTPPCYTWAGTFGHLSEPTPPSSPATLHYKGASFDLVNPHASLLLGAADIETPAEIDGLLDDYFDQKDRPVKMPYNQVSGQWVDADQSASSAEASRRGRTLYPDASSARRNIMRMPGREASPLGAGGTYQESPLAHRAPTSNNALATADTQKLTGDLDAMSIDDATAEGNAEDLRSRPASSQYPQSVYSDPFDLYVSDDEVDDHLNQEHFDNIDALVAAGRALDVRDRDEVFENEGGIAVYDEGANAQAATSEEERDTTIGNIVDAYAYGDVPAPRHDYGMQRSVEHPRGAQPMSPFVQRSGLASNNPFLARSGRRQTQVTARLTGPPHQPAPTPPSRTRYYADYTEIPTSDQTYGATGELLQISPEQRRGQQTSHASTGYGMTYDDDKENLLPDEPSFVYGYDGASNPELPHRDSAFGFVPPVAGIPPYDSPPEPEVPATWSISELPGPARATLHLQDPRPISRFATSRTVGGEDDDAWEDVPGSTSQTNANAPENRLSQISYADTSDYGSSHRTSFPPPPTQGQPSRQQTNRRRSSVYEYVNKAHRVIFGDPAASPEAVEKERLSRAKHLIKANMLEQNLLDQNGDFATKRKGKENANKESIKRNERELEMLRQTSRSTVQEAINQVAQEAELAKAAQTPVVTRLPPAYNPHNSFDRVIEISNRLGKSSPQSNLEWSDTYGTFRTAFEEPRPALFATSNPWSPLPEAPEPVFTPPGRAAAATPTTLHSADINDGIEMMPLTRSKGKGKAPRAAMSSQTALRPFQLATSSEQASPASFNPGRPYTDDELMQREPHWQIQPRAGCATGAYALEHPVRAETLEEGRMLLNPDQVKEARLRKEQDRISNKWFMRAIVLPGAPLVFGLGGMDWLARKESGGRVEEMKGEDKRWAKWVAAPLNTAAWGAGTIALVTTHAAGMWG